MTSERSFRTKSIWVLPYQISRQRFAAIWRFRTKFENPLMLLKLLNLSSQRVNTQIATLLLLLIFFSSANELFLNDNSDKFSIKTDLIEIAVPEYLVIFMYSFLTFLLITFIFDAIYRFYCIQYAKRTLGFVFDIEHYNFESNNSSFFASGLSVKYGVLNSRIFLNSIGYILIFLIILLFVIFIFRSIYIIIIYCFSNFNLLLFNFENIINLSSGLVTLFTILVIAINILPSRLKYNINHTRWNLLYSIHALNEFGPLDDEHWLKKARSISQPPNS